MTKILYITYDGLTDPLGQSQILPYLKGLSEKGCLFHVISCEKKKNFVEQREKIQEIIKDSGITWHHISYTKSPAVISTLFDLWRMKRKAFSLHKKENFQIVHCRSYIASLVGLWLKKNYDTKFIFDMRGFWADERVEGGLWNLKNPFYNIIYNYFKKKETEFLTYADYMVSLTENAKNIIHGWKYIPNQPIKIEVIPCCTDMELFCPEKNNANKQKQLQEKLKISENDFVLSYLGSIGTWYMLDEMLDFFSCLLKVKANSKFLFITNEKKEFVLEKAKEKNIEPDNIIIQKSYRQEVPLYISLSNSSIFFIKPSFSKKASCPTKMGEIMAMGIPVICNTNIGDVEQIINQTNAGILIKKFTETEFNLAIKQLDMLLLKDKNEIRKSANEFFSLEKGVNKYSDVYHHFYIHQ